MVKLKREARFEKRPGQMALAGGQAVSLSGPVWTSGQLILQTVRPASEPCRKRPSEPEKMSLFPRGRHLMGRRCDKARGGSKTLGERQDKSYLMEDVDRCAVVSLAGTLGAVPEAPSGSTATGAPAR